MIQISIYVITGNCYFTFVHTMLSAIPFGE